MTRRGRLRLHFGTTPSNKKKSLAGTKVGVKSFHGVTSDRNDAFGGKVVAAARGLRALLRHLPAVRGAGVLQPGAAGGGAAPGGGATPQDGLPQRQLRQRRVPGRLPAARDPRAPVRRVRPPQPVRGVQLGPGLLHVLRQHPGHHRGLRSHHSSVRPREVVLHLLRSARRSLHHAGAHGLRAAAHAPTGIRPGGRPASLRSGTPARHRRPPPGSAAGGGVVLLHGAGSHLQRTGGVLVLLGRRLLLLHLAVHHRTRRLCAGERTGPEVPSAVPGLRHGLLVPGSDDDVPPAAHLPQDGRPARPDHLPAAATLRSVRAGRGAPAHRGRRPGASCVTEGRRHAAGAGNAFVLQLHQQGLSCATPPDTRDTFPLGVAVTQLTPPPD